MSNKFNADCKGAVMLEFSVVALMLFMLTSGIIEWSLTMYSTHIAQHAAREGARIAAVMPTIDENIVKAVVQSSLSKAGILQEPSIAIDYPKVPAGSATSQKMLSVSLKYTHTSFILRLIGKNNITITGKSNMHYEWQLIKSEPEIGKDDGGSVTYAKH